MMMVEHDRVAQLERKLADTVAEIDRLMSLEAIRDCVYRLSRAIDRDDEEMVRSAFHPDAIIHFGKLYDGGLDGWIAQARPVWKIQPDAHHHIGMVTVRMNKKDEALAESYEVARHRAPVDGQIRDTVLAMRNLDRLSRRNGEWRIIERTKILDVGRILNGAEVLYDNGPLENGAKNKSDASYRFFS
jgi:hypothetical protein